MNDGSLAGVPLMFRVASYRNLGFLLVASLGFMASSAVAQDKPKDSSKDQPKDEVQAQQDNKSAQSQPPDAVDPLKRPVTEKERKKNSKALKQELSKPYKKWLDEDVVYIITDEERA